MMKKLLKNFRILTLLIFLVFALVAINPSMNTDGVIIKNVLQNSTASAAGIPFPNANAAPKSLEIITSIDNQPIKTEDDYYTALDRILPNSTVKIVTKGGSADGAVYNIRLENDVNLGLKVESVPKTNIRKGLDLQGGTRVLLQPEKILSEEDFSLVVSNMKERLNVFGLSDVVIRQANDLSGNQFILVEIAGVNEEEVKELLAKQGKFEAKVGNTTVFIGGQDITYVCRTADCSGIDTRTGCFSTGAGSEACKFSFSISLTPDAAQAQADATSLLEVISDESGDYLSQQIDFYLDDQLVDSLNIGADLKGRPVTDISISGSGEGINREEAVSDTLANMKRLQTILETGSLPTKLNIVKTDNLSPAFGEEFLKNAIFVGLLAILTVSAIIFIRYKRLAIAIPVLITMLSEIILLLGMAALIGWNLDLVAIAGILIAVGTGVDDQIVITDETVNRRNAGLNWKQKIKKAFFIIMAAYFTTVVAMLPLMFAGAGLVKGFALTTILGVTIGVFITRPAFAAMIEILLKE